MNSRPRNRLPMLPLSRRTSRSLSVFLGAGLVTLVVSCATPGDPAAQDADEPLADDTASVPADGPGSEQWMQDYAEEVKRLRAEPEPTVGLATEATLQDGEAPAQPSGELEQVVEEARQRAALVDQRLALLVDSFISEGIALLEAGDLDGAHAQFAHAYELDPLNPLARRLYADTGALTGDGAAELTGVMSEARDIEAARRSQKRLLVTHNIEQGQAALADGDPEKALRHFEDALALVRFNPDANTEGVDEADVAALVDAARNQIARAQADREQALADEARRRQEEFEFAERNRKALKVDGLLRSANRAFLRDDFEGAVETLDELLRLDQHHEEGRNLRRIASRARWERDSRVIREAYREKWQDTFDDLEQDTVIPNDVLTFPDPKDWAATEDRGPRTFADTGRQKTAFDHAVLDRLDEVRIPVDFQGAELGDVLDHISRVSGVNFLMSPDVEDEAPNNVYDLVDRSLQPLSRILKILLEDLSIPPMTYDVRDGIVRVVLQAEARGDYVLEMYDIRDLTFTPMDHPSEDFNLLPSGVDAETFTGGVEDEEPLPLVSEDTLLTLIQDNIARDTWTDDPNRSISQMPGTLIVKTTPDVHSQIQGLLADLRKNTTTLVNIETRFIEVEDSFLEDIGVDLRGLDPGDGQPLEDFGQANAGGVGTPNNPEGIGTGIDSGVFYPGSNGDLKGRTENLFDSQLGESDVLTGGGGISLEALFLDDTNVKAVLRAVTKYQNSNIVNAPSLTLRSGQRGNINVLTNRTYVRDFEPEIAQAAVIAQPELGVVRDGIVLDVRAVASADRRFITLELRPTLAELIPDENGDVLPEELVSLGTPNANNVTIQLPELKIQRLRTTATIPDGGTLLLGGLKTSIEQDNTSETPFLADIPIISFFFSRQGQYTSKRKMLILLTAKVIAPEEQEPSTDYLR